MTDENKFPPDGEWVPYELPWVEGRCIPEKKLVFKDGKWSIWSMYPVPDEDENEQPETMDREQVMSWLEGLSQDDWRLFHSDSEVSNIAKAALALLKEQEESVPLKPLCKWLAGYAAPPGDTSWLPMFGSLEKAWEHELKELFTS